MNSTDRDGAQASHVLSLCDRTGNMVRPWAEAGHVCIAVDTAHSGVSVEDVGAGSIVYVEADVREYEPPAVEYAAAFAFPPCTDLAVSGARWFQDKGLTALAEAIEIVGACHETLTALGCPWMLENPKSTLSTHWRTPDYRFDPYEYAHYTERDESYSKETWLWTGGGFRMPVADGVPESQADDRIHRMGPGEDRSAKRSETPMGFARAVFLAHQEPERYARAGTGVEQARLVTDGGEELQGRGSHAIEVDEKTRERYDRKKAQMDAADPNLPDMSNDQFMKCLLDTLEAVESGFYTDCSTPQDRLSEEEIE